MSKFNPAESEVQITSLLDQSENLVLRSKELQNEFSIASREIIVLHQDSEKLISQSQKLFEKIKHIKDK